MFIKQKDKTEKKDENIMNLHQKNLEMIPKILRNIFSYIWRMFIKSKDKKQKKD